MMEHSPLFIVILFTVPVLELTSPEVLVVMSVMSVVVVMEGTVKVLTRLNTWWWLVVMVVGNANGGEW